MDGVIGRRRVYLSLMQRLTLEKGKFTIEELAEIADLPRSTARDWVIRLSGEGCLAVIKKPHGRVPGEYVAVSATPETACRKIFTAVEGDMVEVVHECLSSSCAAFCAFHHGLGQKWGKKGIFRDGTLLREFIPMGSLEQVVGLLPLPAVSIIRVWQEKDEIIQQIKSIGGPAFSLTAMMGRASGVKDVTFVRHENYTEGLIRTQALSHLIIGVDDTDDDGNGATFSLTIALLQHLSAIKGVYPICHHVIMLYPKIFSKTAGNSCSSIELAVVPGIVEKVCEECTRFVSDESLSSEWGVAIKHGFLISASLARYGESARSMKVSCEEAIMCASDNGILLMGGQGKIGALGAISLSRQPVTVQLDPSISVVS